MQLINKHKIYNHGSFYAKICAEIQNEECRMRGIPWVKKMKSLLIHLAVDHVDILRQMANATCSVPNRSLFEEIDAYYNKMNDELQQEINVIDRKAFASETNNRKSLQDHKSKINKREEGI